MLVTSNAYFPSQWKDPTLLFPLKMDGLMSTDVSPFLSGHLIIAVKQFTNAISYPVDKKKCVYRWYPYKILEPQST